VNLLDFWFFLVLFRVALFSEDGAHCGVQAE
jgi:hypothetical protein